MLETAEHVRTPSKSLLDGIVPDGAAVAGCFKRKNGPGYAVMLVNAQNPWNPAAAINVVFKMKGTAYVKGRATPLGASLKLASGEGVFITLD